MEDRLPVLDGDDPAGGEGAAVADAVDRVDDRRAGVPGAQEVRVQGVREAVLGHGPARRHQRLGGHLAAEDAGDDGGAGLPPEDVPLDPLQVEQIEQGIQGIRSAVLVVRFGHLDYRPIDFAMIDFMISLVPP